MPDWLLCQPPWRPVAEAAHPLLGRYRDLESREARAGLRADCGILIEDTGAFDPRIGDFCQSVLSRKAASTQRSYLLDYKLFFSFLARRDLRWDEASRVDVDAYAHWRLRDPANPGRVTGARFNRGLAALILLYSWAADSGYVSTNIMSRVAAAREERTSNAKWLTPRAYVRWRDVGLAGYDETGVPLPGWRGRNAVRNQAFADLLYASGLRLTEAGGLLLAELPQEAPAWGYADLHVPRSLGKRGARLAMVSASGARSVKAYLLTARRAVVARAKLNGRYDSLQDILVATGTRRHKQQLTYLIEDAVGSSTPRESDSLTLAERQRLFVRREGGLEPEYVWLGDDGIPLHPDSWDVIFSRASRRCQERGIDVSVHPHMLRHSFALKMLLAYTVAFDTRYNLTPDERREFQQAFGDPYVIVKNLLGHRSEEVTKRIYLEPLTHLHAQSLLSGDDDVAALMGRIAGMTALVQDVSDAGADN